MTEILFARLDELTLLDTLSLKKAANLSDLTDVVAARTNLGVAIGVNVQAWDATLDGLSLLNSTAGLVVQTAVDTFTKRTLQPPVAGISITNPAGTAGDPTFVLTNDLLALEGLGSTGIAVRIAADTWAQRTITGTASRLAVSNGDGVAGNPTLNIDTAYVGQATITTLGTIATGVWQGTKVAEGFGGTNQSTYVLGDLLYASGANTLSKLAGNITTAKQYLSQTGNATISAAPAWATIAGADITGAALTQANDTNVTLTLGGTPATALLRAASLTMGWTGTLAVARGGTGGGSASGTLLDNITGFASTALLVRTGAGTYAFRTIAGTANEITVTNGDGVSANPTISLPAALTFTGKTITGGTLSGVQTFGLFDIQQSLQLSGDISPAQLVANTNDWAPANFSTNSVIRFSTDAPRDITGLAGGTDGLVKIILNIGAFSAIFKVENASSTAGNRFAIGADITLGAGQGLAMIYDSTSSRWRAFGSGSGGGGGGGVSSITAGTGLSGGVITSSGTIALDINSLTVDSSPDDTVDYVATYDASAATSKKVLLQVARNGVVSVITYTSTQTITIPAGATRAFVRLKGGGGGAKAGAPGAASAGEGGYLEKYLTGLTAGLTLALTIGAGGAVTPTAGGNSSLASGTQTITTLTANGGASANAGVSSNAAGAGGTATNGDVNITGSAGTALIDTATNVCFVMGGGNPFSPISGAFQTTTNNAKAGVGFGGGAQVSCFSPAASAVGSAGVCQIIWIS